MIDQIDWETYVLLEISDALGNPKRLLEINECLVAMEAADLIPDDVAISLFTHYSNVSE